MRASLTVGLHPELPIPRQYPDKARHRARDKGVADIREIISIEDFIALNIVEMSIGGQHQFIVAGADILKRAYPPAGVRGIANALEIEDRIAALIEITHPSLGCPNDSLGFHG